MIGLINRLFNPNQRQIDRIKPIVASINELEKGLENQSDEELTKVSLELKNKVRAEMATLVKTSETYRQDEQSILDKYLPQAFALVRENFKRTLGERSFDEQLMVGILLHQGKAAEQKTGEGKTHAAVHPLYLNSLTGRGAHIVTVNDYLARRDAEWMGLVYSRLGVSVGCINTNNVTYLFDDTKVDGIKPEGNNWRKFAFGHGTLLKEVSRKEAYSADITYGTNNEFGFDYLRDNMTHSLSDLVQVNVIGEIGVHHFAIVDEVDSILIDEARTPLIISAPAHESNELYVKFANLVKRLNTEDYDLDEKTKGVYLTNLGTKKIEQWLGVENVYDDFTFAHHLEQALKAQFAYQNDNDYVEQEGQVKIVDEFTGRILEEIGRAHV